MNNIDINNQTPFLVSISPGEKFDRYRRQADKMALFYESSQYQDYADRIKKCGSFLLFRQTVEGLKLSEANFCRVRNCPTCQWRRSLLWQSKILRKLEKIEPEKMVLITLTIKNCPIKLLKKTLKSLEEGWQNLTTKFHNQTLLNLQGYVRATEVNRNDNQAHPHFHILAIVEEEFYIETQELAQKWKKCLKLSYTPICDIRLADRGGVAEIAKYVAKPGDLLESRGWLLEFTKQVHKRRFISCGGILKGEEKLSNSGEENLINVGEDKKLESIPGLPELSFKFNQQSKRYILEDLC